MSNRSFRELPVQSTAYTVTWCTWPSVRSTLMSNDVVEYQVVSTRPVPSGFSAKIGGTGSERSQLRGIAESERLTVA